MAMRAETGRMLCVVPKGYSPQPLTHRRSFSPQPRRQTITGPERTAQTGPRPLGLKFCSDCTLSALGLRLILNPCPKPHTCICTRMALARTSKQAYLNNTSMQTDAARDKTSRSKPGTSFQTQPKCFFSPLIRLCPIKFSNPSLITAVKSANLFYP